MAQGYSGLASANVSAPAGVVSTGNLAVTAGSTILVAIRTEDASGVDSVKWGTTNFGSPILASASNKTFIYALYNAPSHAAQPINIDCTSSAPLFLQYIAGAATGVAANPLDKTAQATGTSGSPSSGATATTTVSEEVCFGVMSNNGLVADTAGTWSNSWTGDARLTNATGGILATGFLVVHATGAQTAAQTGATSRTWDMQCLTLAALPSNTSLTLSTASGASAVLSPTIDYGTVSQTLSIASGASVALAETVDVGAVSNTLAIAGGVSAALAMDTMAADNVSLGIAVATSTAPGFDSVIGHLDWPAAAGATATTVVVQPQLNTAASVGIRSYGSPYFAAWMLNTASAYSGSGQWPGIVGLEVTAVLILSLHGAPVQLSSPDEPHWLMSQQDIVNNVESFSIGVTPNLAICASTSNGVVIRTLPGVMPVDNQFHQINFATQGDFANTGIISLDGVPVVMQTGCAGAGATIGRTMLFNGIAGTTRCACSILAASIGGDNPPLEWPLNEGSGMTISGAQVLSSIGTVPIVYQTPSDFPGTDFTLTPGWFDPRPLNPLVWGSVPTHDSGSAWSWITNTQYAPITVQKPNYRPILGPPTQFTPETDQSPG